MTSQHQPEFIHQPYFSGCAAVGKRSRFTGSARIPSSGIRLSAGLLSQDSTTITATATSSADLSAGWFVAGIGVFDEGGTDPGYPWSEPTSGAVASQSIVITKAEYVIGAASIVNFRIGYCPDSVFNPATVVWSAVAPIVQSAAISGTATSGQTLTASHGVVAGSITQAVTYQWQHAEGGAYANIGGATASTFVLTDTQIGSTIKVVVTSTNSAGAGSATSSATSAVAGSITYIQSSTVSSAVGDANGTTSVNTGAMATTTGHTLIVTATLCLGTAFGTPTDTGGNTYGTPVIATNSAGKKIATWIAHNITGHAANVVNIPYVGGTDIGNAQQTEVSGLNASAAFDKSATGAETSATVHAAGSSGTLSTSAQFILVAGMGAFASAGTPANTDGSYTQISAVDGFNNQKFVTAYKIVAANTAVSWSGWSSVTVDNACSVLGTFKT